MWGAAWLYKATKLKSYWNYLVENIDKVESPQNAGSWNEFGWDAKNAGINVLVSKVICLAILYLVFLFICKFHMQMLKDFIL